LPCPNLFTGGFKNHCKEEVFFLGGVEKKGGGVGRFFGVNGETKERKKGGRGREGKRRENEKKERGREKEEKTEAGIEPNSTKPADWRRKKEKGK
ncbi:hypothetical protein NUU24_26120, partial [Escherichia coli]|nr:hypothetical protein [Escherichia coli]